jgi:tRNA/rRNA methyltransferase
MIYICLSNPQMGENIGASARAMLNCGQENLRLIAPQQGWPNERADTLSAGALAIMPPVETYDTLKACIADCHYVFATTARPRDATKAVFNVTDAAKIAQEKSAQGQNIAFIFGGERAGLDNEDISLCNAIVTAPLNPDFASLNLAQAVLMVSYELSKHQYNQTQPYLPTGDSALADAHKIHFFLDRLELLLEENHFFRTNETRLPMMRNIRNLFLRTEITEQEVQTLQGMITALTGGKTPPR